MPASDVSIVAFGRPERDDAQSNVLSAAAALGAATRLVTSAEGEDFSSMDHGSIDWRRALDGAHWLVTSASTAIEGETARFAWGAGMTFGELEGSFEEILRFDCFNKAPHYHYGFSYIAQPPVPIDPAAVGDPLAWVCRCIQTRLPEMLGRAEASALGADCNRESLLNVAETLEKRGRDLMPNA